jgi:hypothetical protein
VTIPLRTARCLLVSPLVAVKVYSQFVKELWTTMLAQRASNFRSVYSRVNSLAEETTESTRRLLTRSWGLLGDSIGIRCCCGGDESAAFTNGPRQLGARL